MSEISPTQDFTYNTNYIYPWYNLNWLWFNNNNLLQDIAIKIYVNTENTGKTYSFKFALFTSGNYLSTNVGTNIVITGYLTFNIIYIDCNSQQVISLETEVLKIIAEEPSP